MHVVIFTGGDAPHPVDAAYYFTHYQKMDYIICADSGLDNYEKYKAFFGESVFKNPDLVIGDMDSVSNPLLLEKYGAVLNEIYPSDKDFTDTELALISAHEVTSSYETDLISLIGGCGGRTDHFVSILDSFSSPYHADIWVTMNQMVCYLKEGYTMTIENLRKGDYVSVSRLTSSFDTGSIKTKGLKWEYPAFRKAGMPSISNTISDDFADEGKPIKITAEKNSFLIYLPFNATVRHPVIEL